MKFSIKYKPLVKVNILHQYYLNKGKTEFADMTETEKEKQLTRYNFSDFLTLRATTETLDTLNGYHMVLKSTNTGFTIYTKISETDDSVPFIVPDNSLELSFLLNLNTYTFLTFSNLKFENSGKLFFFSNKRLASEASNFPLIKKPGQNTTVKNKYALNDESTLHELKQLKPDEKQNLFGIIRLHIKGESGALNITTNQQKLITPPPVFELNFENRKTIWRYIFPANQTVKNTDGVRKEAGNKKQLISREKLPLTRSGFISLQLGGKDLPNPSSEIVKPDSESNKIFSEIYM